MKPPVSLNSSSHRRNLLIFAAVILIAVISTYYIYHTATNTDNRMVPPGGPTARYRDYCMAQCETKDYVDYCTNTFKNFTGSMDWNKDKREGMMVSDRSSLWDFCEDRVYCFLVTKCPAIGMEGCRQYMCGQYREKYGNSDQAIQMMKETYLVSDNVSQCYEERNGTNTYFTDLIPEENWLYSGFVSKGWCGNASSIEV